MISVSFLRIIFVIIISLMQSGVVPCFAGTEGDIPVGRFSSGILSGWKEENVWNAKKTGYSLIKDNGKTVLMGKSVNAASALLHKITIDPKIYPVIRWSWKIDHTIKKGNERTKAGHDFAARIYVIFPRGLFTYRAIEYVWGNVMAKGEMLRSPYSSQAVMIAVDSGDEMAGKWVSHHRNYVEDYRAAFGEEPPKAGGVALMTDSDNTGETAVGYFGDIDILTVGKDDEHHDGGEHRSKEILQEWPFKPLIPLQEPPPVREGPLKESAPSKE